MMTTATQNQKKIAKVSPSDRQLSLRNKSDVEYLNAQITLYTNGVDRSDTEANSTDRGLASQLILITTVLITANIVVFSNGELMKSLIPDQKGISLSGDVMLVFSLLSGIKYYAVAKKFHMGWSSARNDVATSIAQREAHSRNEIIAIVHKKTEHLSPQIKSRYLTIQIVLLVIALLTFLLLAASLLTGIQFKDIGAFLHSVWQFIISIV